MKKIWAILLVLCLFCSAALAEYPIGTQMRVVNCNEFVSLRCGVEGSDPLVARLTPGAQAVYLGEAENGYVHVGSALGEGYVSGNYLAAENVPAGNEIAGRMDRNQRYNVNLFLSNFTESDLAWEKGCFDLSDNAQMIDFAINHIWFNQQDKLEFFDGEEYNTSLDCQYVRPVIEKYFGVEPLDYVATWVELFGYDAADGTYYKLNYAPAWDDDLRAAYFWQETGGHVPSGFAIATSVLDAGGGYYHVFFNTYGSGYDWTNDCCYYSASEAEAAYPPYGCCPTGYALIHADDLNERSTFRLVRYAFRH